MDPNTEAGETVRQRFFANSRRKTKEVKFGDVDLVVKELSPTAITAFIPHLQGDDNVARNRAVAEMVVLCTYDTAGKLVFEAGDVQQILDDLGTTEFSEFSEHVLAVNSRTPKAQEDIAKNSPAPTSGLLAD